jgi:hypothetical protein
MVDQPYPHSRNDCYCCREFDADMTAHYEHLTGADLRWCHRCAGIQLARLVSAGHVVTVRSLSAADADGTTAVPRRGQPNGHADEPQWTVDLAEQVLRHAIPSASTFLRALIDEGGKATVQRLKELTNGAELRYMTLSLNTAARKIAGEQLYPQRYLALPGRDPENPRRQAVHDYQLPAQLVPIFDEALGRLGR